jgi:hypothetical protein
MVADILNRYNDPLEGCKAVVQTSYDMWLQYEVRTDDITIMAMYIDGCDAAASNNNSGDGGTGNAVSTVGSMVRLHSEKVSVVAAAAASPSSIPSAPATVAAAVETNEERPVRRAMSRAKRNMIQIHSEDDVSDAPMSLQEIALLVVEKNKFDELLINSAIRSNFLFQHLSTQQRNDVVAVMKSVVVDKDEFVIKQGDKGDLFYIVDSGKFEVRVLFNPEAISSIDEKNPSSAGNVVHVYDSGPDHHPGFGELSLM